MYKQLAKYTLVCLCCFCPVCDAQKPQAPTRVTFEGTSMGEVTDEDGAHLGFTIYKASDGNTLTVYYEDIGSPAKAQKYFEKQISKAVRLVERKKKLDPSGKVIGERAEILVHVENDAAIPAVMWTDGATFHEICSESRKSVLELEAVYKY